MYLHAHPTVPAKPAPVSVQEGTPMEVHLGRPVSSAHALVGERFTGKLAKAIVVNGVVIVPEGTEVNGKVMQALAGGRLAGGASLKIELTSFSLDGKEYGIQTSPIMRLAQGQGKRTAELAGGAAAIGAAIGALAHRGRGALIGAAVGAGVGAAGSAVTSKAPEVVLPTNSLLTFRLTEKLVMAPKPVTPTHPTLADMIRGLFS